MNVSAIAIRRPVFTVMVAVALVVLGLIGLGRLGTDLFPDVSMPIVVVTVPYPGASPAEAESLVVRPLEEQIVSLNGIDRVIGQAVEGMGRLIIQFKLEKNPQVAGTEVRERVAQTRGRLPKQVLEPIVSRIDFGATPAIIYTIAGEGMSLAQVQKFAKDEIKPSLEQVGGVASVEIQGGAEREIHVDLDLGRIDALRISPVQVMEAVQRENVTTPAGRFDQGTREVNVRTMGELGSVDALRDLVVATSSAGTPVRLRDVARIEDGYQELRQRIRVNGADAVIFNVAKQSGANTVSVAAGAKARMAELEKTFPPGVRATPLIDSSEFIQENVDEVNVAIFFGGAMAILVVLVFMLDVRSTLISAVALPTSVVATFFVMYVAGFTLNMMTLLGLSLAIGLLIDDAVVVRENISKHLERGAPPVQAALEGTKEIALSVLATTLTVVAVFVPVAFMSGTVGQFFKQFGLTIAAAVLVSLFVAFTLDPMLSSRFSKPHVPLEQDPWRTVKRPFLAFFDALEHTYRQVLAWAVRRKLVVGILSVAAFFTMFPIAGLAGFDFMNEEDRGQFAVELELPAGTSLDEATRLSAGAEQRLLSDPRFKTVLATVGLDNAANKINWRVMAVPKNERTSSLQDLEDTARAAARTIPGARVSVTPPPFIEGLGVQAPIMVMVRGDRYEELAPLADEMAAAMRAIPGIEDVSVRYSPGQPELRVSVDREKAATYGLPTSAVGAALRVAMHGEEASRLRQGKDEVPILVRLDEASRSTARDVLNLTMWTPAGPIALRDLATVDPGEGPAMIEREGRSRRILIWAAPRGRSLGELVPEMQAAFAKIEMPKGYSYMFDGQIKDMNESNDSMGVAFGLALVFIYIVLASQFESFIHPFTIVVTTVPLAAVGAVYGVFLSGTSLAMGSMIGIVFLMGLVTKNAILVLDRALARIREHGETPLQAILEAGPERLRPILMTSAAMILGMLPTAISRGEGSEFRAPMAIAVIGGVLSSTALSLVVVPVVFLAIENLKARLARRRGAAVPTPATLPAE